VKIRGNFDPSPVVAILSKNELFHQWTSEPKSHYARLGEFLASAKQTDDAVVQRPDDMRVDIPLFHTQDAGPGAVTSALLRRIAYKAGAYAPGIQEHMFFELNAGPDGGSLGKVESWFARRTAPLHAMGYRLAYRRVTEPTQSVLQWVKQGNGYRAAMMPVGYLKLHPTASPIEADNINYAIGATVDSRPGMKSDTLLVMDPWPGIGGIDRVTVTDEWNDQLEKAHREKKYFALIYYWVGWS
jgi:hypothetical protein